MSKIELDHVEKDAPPPPETGEAQKNNSDLVKNTIIEAQSEGVKLFLAFFKSCWFKWWIVCLTYAALFLLIVFACVSLWDIMFSETPKPLFISIWSNAFEFIKTVFAIIGVFTVFVRSILKLWEQQNK
ncbi:MAG: hypothetical protein LBO72_01390 [Helicobacteraceae bacterium]|nr:hypothetical protein [Helicobacteraceae bacterium]